MAVTERAGEDSQDELARRFEEHRGPLRGVAYRLLGSLADADDAVQETWLRLSRSDAGAIDNLAAWLRTVVSRICLDMLRSRTSRREDFVGHLPEEVWDEERTGAGPESEAVLVDAVGRALLVVLDSLSPAERVAFVLHDLFAVPFAEIAPVVGRTPVTTKKLASRARHRVQGTSTLPAPELDRQRQVVDAFRAAARDGDLNALLAVLAPDVVRHADPLTLAPGASARARGADEVARETVVLRRNARFAATALIDGRPGLVVAPRGRLLLALAVTVEADRVSAYEVIADPARLSELEISLVPGSLRPSSGAPGSPSA
ncbi:sigma-70 family RNA polymerase sigma factor [Streptomyces sp. VRA16 Mangrove soil]|uniref:sigma-70 family RNA polymerase sigma factor n=1 Tax=Streptomyces sp. VRA16 Mangrove soil TaxID=2817434 RepID=UPI001A9F1B32|nr:sigma-70 family RNA polymerase sigma factor [Streptomyces sp. VRA16 Mangrove soil]MBO1336766.1 sigma-70 family RNA polymerase sigma factor [Streptomyces sp. VRA16 Mangrove soil]